MSASPAATSPRSPATGRGSARLAITRYSVGAMHSTATGSRASTSRRSWGSKRASCSRAAAPRIHGAMNTLRADLLQPLPAVHQTRLAGPRVEPVLGLRALPGQVALGVEDGLRLARGPARERDQARVLGVELDRVGLRDAQQTVVGHDEHRTARLGGIELVAVALVADDRRGPRDVEAQAQVAGAQLLGAREHDGADAEARDDRQDPLGPVADEREDDIAAPDAVPAQGARQRARAGRHLAEGPLAPLAAARDLDERRAFRVGGVDEVAREVHGRRNLPACGRRVGRVSEPRVVAEVQIAAPPEDVWRALREPGEIRRWFGWQYDGLAGEIDYIFREHADVAEEGRVLEFGSGDAIALEPRDRGTVVRVTRPAAPPGAWDEIDEGWLTFAAQLRLVLERHRDEPRRTLRLSGKRRGGEAPAPLEALGLAGAAARGAGERYEAVTAVGEPLSGEVWLKHEHLAGLTVDAYGDGLVVIGHRPAQGEPPHGAVSVVLTAYGLGDEAWDLVRERWTGWWDGQVDEPRHD